MLKFYQFTVASESRTPVKRKVPCKLTKLETDAHSDAEFTDDESICPKKIREHCTGRKYGPSSSHFHHMCFDGLECEVFKWGYGSGTLISKYGFPKEYAESKLPCSGRHAKPRGMKQQSIFYRVP